MAVTVNHWNYGFGVYALHNVEKIFFFSGNKTHVHGLQNLVLSLMLPSPNFTLSYFVLSIHFDSSFKNCLY